MVNKVHCISALLDSPTTACGRVLSEYMTGRLFINRNSVITVADPRQGDIDTSCELCLKIMERE